MASPIDAAWAVLKQEPELYSGHTADELRNIPMDELQALRTSLQEQYGPEPFAHLLPDEDDLREHSYYQGPAPTDWYAPPPRRWIPRPPPRE